MFYEEVAPGLINMCILPHHPFLSIFIFLDIQPDASTVKNGDPNKND